MAQVKRKDLARGVWGGQDVMMTVGSSSAQLDFACGSGEIAGPITLTKDNSFKADGTYSRRGPGPTRQSDAGKPATYIGRLSGSRLTLKIILKSDNSEIGEFVLEKGKSVRIHRCY
jgi:hypothetical protein